MARTPPPPFATHEALEQEIREHPDDPGPYLVYADWLQGQKDPRGQLITIQARRASEPENAELAATEAALLSAHGEYFFPEVLSRARACTVTWRNGFIAHVQLAADNPKKPALATVARAVLGHPSARFLRSITLGPLGTPMYNYGPIVEALGHPLLAELHVGDFGAEDNELQRSAAAGVVPGALPALEKLTIRAGTIRNLELAHARLRELTITTVTMGPVDVVGLFASDLPKLEVLELHARSLSMPPEALNRLSSASLFPNLRTLVLAGAQQPHGLVMALLGAPLLAHLEELEVSRCDLDDQTANAMIAARDRLAHLRRLDVSGSHVLSPAVAARLAEATGAIVHRAPPPITVAAVARRAPDGASIDAARQLASPERWSALGYDAQHERVWGEYETQQRHHVFAYLRDSMTGCTCSNYTRPCEHALALLLIATTGYPFRAARVFDPTGR